MTILSRHDVGLGGTQTPPLPTRHTTVDVPKPPSTSLPQPPPPVTHQYGYVIAHMQGEGPVAVHEEVVRFEEHGQVAGMVSHHLYHVGQAAVAHERGLIVRLNLLLQGTTRPRFFLKKLDSGLEASVYNQGQG